MILKDEILRPALCKQRAGLRMTGSLMPEKKILIINPFGIGDVLFTTPLIKAIKEAYPEAFIGYWCNERAQEILKDNPRINKIFALSRGDLKKIFDQSIFQGLREFFGLLRAIKKEKFDTTIDFSLDHRYNLIAKLLGIKERIGFNYKNRGRFLSKKINLTGYSDKHVVEYYLELLKFLDIKPKNQGLELFVSEEIKKRCATIFAHAGINKSEIIIGIAPGAGASWGKDAKLKHWPAIRFAQLADRLSSELKTKIVVLGDPSEKSISETIVNMMKNKPLDLTGQTNLREFAGIISNLNILVTNDGGPLHMACALGVKTVSIFGPVDERVYGPYPASGKHIVLKSALDCRPCYQNFRLNICDKDKECLTLIDTNQVFDAVRRIL